MARVILVFKKNVIKDHPFVNESMNIGRDKGNDIVIDNLIVSNFHAKTTFPSSTSMSLQSSIGFLVSFKLV